MKGCRSNVTLAARGTLSTHVLVSSTILQRNGLILGLGQEIYKLSLEHLVTEGKMLKTKQNKTPKETKKSHNYGSSTKGHGSQPQGLPMAKAEITRARKYS